MLKSLLFLKEIGWLSKETGSESTATKTNRFYFWMNLQSIAVCLLGIIFSSMHFFVDETHTLLYHKGLSQLFEVASLYIQYAILYPPAPSHTKIVLDIFA